jgi:hypothetical protein
VSATFDLWPHSRAHRDSAVLSLGNISDGEPIVEIPEVPSLCRCFLPSRFYYDWSSCPQQAEPAAH